MIKYAKTVYVAVENFANKLYGEVKNDIT